MPAGKLVRLSEELYNKLTRIKKECKYSTYSELIQVMYYAYITSKPHLYQRLLLKEKLEEREKDNQDFKEGV